MGIRVSTPPAEPLLTKALVKRNLRVEHSEDDDLIDAFIAAVESHLDAPDGIMRRGLVDQELEVTASGWKGSAIALGGVSAIVEVKYWPSDGGVEITVPPSDYELVSDNCGARISLRSTPAVAVRQDAVTMTYTIGYGPAAADVPAAIRQAAMLLACHYYQHREAVIAGPRLTELPLAVRSLLAPHRFMSV